MTKIRRKKQSAHDEIEKGKNSWHTTTLSLSPYTVCDIEKNERHWQFRLVYTKHSGSSKSSVHSITHIYAHAHTHSLSHWLIIDFAIHKHTAIKSFQMPAFWSQFWRSLIIQIHIQMPYIHLKYCNGDVDDDDDTLWNNNNVYLENLISIGVNLIKSGHTLCHSIRIKQHEKFHNTRNICLCLIFTRELTISLRRRYRRHCCHLLLPWVCALRTPFSIFTFILQHFFYGSRGNSTRCGIILTVYFTNW